MSAQKPITAGLAVRMIAAKTLAFVLKGNSFSPLEAGDIQDARDRALANRMITVALRRHGHLNIILEALLKQGVPKHSGVFEASLRLGLTELLFMPGQAEHSAVHLAVEVVRRDKRASRYAKLLNAILRRGQRESGRWRTLETNKLFPPWLCENWRSQYGEVALRGFGDALLAGASLDLTLAEESSDLVEALSAQRTMGDSVRIGARNTPVAELPFYDEGRWWVQDVAAGIPARLFSLPVGACVLDMCAAPGGKTLQLIKAGYEVTALDRDEKRMKVVAENLKRLNYTAEMIIGDGREFIGEKKFDGVLLDAPCTATGTFRRHPEVIWHRTAKDVAARVLLQRALIANAVENLGSGGTMIYCVCSLQKEEGEDQARWILSEFPQLKGDPLSADLLEGLRAGLSPEGYLRTHPGLELEGRDGEPTIKGSMDGFFAARFRKI